MASEVDADEDDELEVELEVRLELEFGLKNKKGPESTSGTFFC